MADPQFDLSGIPDATSPSAKEFNLAGIPDVEPTKKTRGQELRERASANRQRDETRRQSGEEPVLQALMGAGRGAISTVQGLASPIRKLFGMQPATPPPEETTTAGKVGRTAEQVGEFFVPEAVAGKVAGVVKGGRLAKAAVKAAVTGAGTGVVAAAQGDEHPLRAAAIGSTGPVVDLAAPAAWKLLRQGSKASLAKVLGASHLAPDVVNEAAKKVVPMALDEGLKPTWASWLRQRKGAQNVAGKTLETALEGPLGDSVVPLKPVVEALDELANSTAQHVMRAEETLKAAKSGGIGGHAVDTTVVYNQRLLKKINELKTILTNHGEVIQARQLVDLKRSWDDFVYKAGSFQNRTKILTSLEARAKHAAANAARGVLDSETPSLAALDKTYSLNTRLYELVRKAAIGEEVGPAVGRVGQRASSALGGKTARAAAGAVAGAGLGYQTQHDVTGAVLGGLVGGTSARMLETAFASPAWRTLPAVSKQALADAISSGKAEVVRKAITAISAEVAAGEKKAAKPTETGKAEGKTSSLTGLEKASGIGPTGMDRMTGATNAARKQRGLGPVDPNVRAEMPILPAGKAMLKLAERSPEAAMKIIESAKMNPKVAQLLSSRRWEELVTKFGGNAGRTVSAAQETALAKTAAETGASAGEMSKLKTLLFGE